ncbi:MAG TPA: hypothetical protein VFO29_04270 [Candidatus Rubrimentiphilum sp.]|nr:hypothetical protein [Candidatus Rubrimentiphilum sp.]
MPEVQARRMLSGRIGAFSVLAPVGSFAGKGTLRVLRVTTCHGEVACHPEVSKDPEVTRGEQLELTCGYESYERIN